MLKVFVEDLGDAIIKYSVRTSDFLVFLFQCMRQMFLPSSYSRLSINFLIEQIYISSIKHIFSFVFSAIFLGSILIGIAISFSINFNLQEQIGDLLVLFVINEFSPFFTTIFFIFAYTLASAEKIQNIRNGKKNLINEIYIPKLINIIFMTPLMSLLFAIVMLASGYFISSFYLNIDLLTYKELIISSISFENILILFLKSFLFGFVSIIVPIYYGHKKEKDSLDVTGSIIKILIIILSMLLLIELLSILIFY